MDDQKSAMPTLMMLPPELLVKTCQMLDRSRLKNARLVNTKLGFAATGLLFSIVHLRPNMDSFCRLRMICCHPTLSKMVRTLAYSSKMIYDWDVDVNFAQWQKHRIGDGFHCSRQELDDFKATLTADQLEYHYQRFCEYLYSQRLLQKYDLEYDYLVTALGSLPGLQNICFDSDILKSRLRGPMSLDSLSQMGREALVEPWALGQHESTDRQFANLLLAVNKAQKHVKVFEARGVPWDALCQSVATLAAMTNAVEHVDTISITTNEAIDPLDGRESIARMISNASSLKVLEISFTYLPYENKTDVVDLSHLLEYRTYWPCLRRLHLQAMSTTELFLRKFLTTHMSTLRSLELKHLDLDMHESESGEVRGSWVSIILFLQSDLELKDVRLGGNLSNNWDEAWCIHGPDEDDQSVDIQRSSNSGGSCLKHRIERFVVHGGEFPLMLPENMEDVDDHQPYSYFYERHAGDRSWYFCHQLLW